MIKCIIVEDEIMARKSLENLCHKNEHLHLIESFESAELALQKINEEEIDLIFLDMEMPGMNGIELLEALPYFPQIVFTTSNKDYAYEAFEYDVTDFLKKPFTPARFTKAVEKVSATQNRLENVANHSAKTEIYVKHDRRFVRIALEDILYFENVGDYVKVFTTESNYVFHSTIKALDAQLNHPRFLKVHRSYIINLNKIVDIEDNTLVIEKKVIPISRAHKPLLMKHLNIL